MQKNFFPPCTLILCIIATPLFGCEMHERLPRFADSPRIDVSSPTSPWTPPNTTPLFSPQKPFFPHPALSISVPERSSPPLVNDWPHPHTKRKNLGSPIEVVINADVDPRSPVSTGIIVLPEDELNHTIFPDGNGIFKIISGKDFYITINRTANIPEGTMFISDHWAFSTQKISSTKANRLTLSVRDLILAADQTSEQAISEFGRSAYQTDTDGIMVFQLGSDFFQQNQIPFIASMGCIHMVKNSTEKTTHNVRKDGPGNT